MNTNFTCMPYKGCSRQLALLKKQYLLFFMLCFLSLNVNSSLYGQCPTTSCDTHTSNISTATLPECGTTVVKVDGDLDNNSDCEDSNGDNCWKYVITQHDPQITGITADIGKGNGCNGEVNTFYTLIDGVCRNEGSSGSQNTFTFDFGVEGTITIWLCDNSSGQVSLCDLCAEPLAPAPVELANFTVQSKDKAVNLNWQTETEDNNSGFEIERSTNSRDWDVIGFERGQGTSTQVQSYSFADMRPLPGYNYYRLKQIDFDGQFEYSNIQSVLIEALEHKLMEIFPNPSDGLFTLSLHNPNAKKASIKLFDSTGNLIWVKRFKGDDLVPYWEKEFNLPQGEIYFVQTQVGEQVETEKITVISRQ